MKPEARKQRNAIIDALIAVYPDCLSAKDISIKTGIPTARVVAYMLGLRRDKLVESKGTTRSKDRAVNLYQSVLSHSRAEQPVSEIYKFKPMTSLFKGNRIIWEVTRK